MFSPPKHLYFTDGLHNSEKYSMQIDQAGNYYEYDSSQRRSPALEEFRELFRYQDLLRLLISNSLKTRYKRSTLGVLWTLLNPLLNTVVLTIAFSQLLRFELESYPIYILSGLVMWTFFTQTITQSMDTLVWGSQLLKRIYMPKTIFAVAVLGNGITNLLLSLIPLALIMLVMGHPISVSVLFLPVGIVILSLFTLGLSLLLSTIAVFFVDTVEIVRVLLQAWFFLTPLIYPIEVVPPQFLPLYRLNPMVYLLDIFRQPIYSGVVPGVPVVLAAALLGVVVFILGWWVFTNKSDELAYRI